MADKNFIVKNGLEVGGQEVVSSSGVVTSAALGGQTLASTDSPTFANLTVSNDLAVSGDLNLTGDLNITGDVNSLSVTDLDVTDQTITLGAGQVESASGGSGIVVDGSSASILWDETNDEWDFNKGLNITGGLNLSGDIFGTSNFDIRSTGNIFNTYGNSSSVYFRTQDGTNRVIINSSGAITSTGAIKTDYADEISMDYAPSLGSYYKGMSGRHQSSSTARGLHIFNYDNDSNQGINFWVGTNASKVFAARINSSGNFGIGTDNPLAPLTISNSGGPGVEFSPGVTNFGVANTNYIASYDRSASTYRDISFDMGGTESNAIRFQTGGKVGIGTASPAAKVDILNTADTNDFILTNDGNDTNMSMFSYRNSSNHNIIMAKAARGTLASPATIAEDESMLRIIARGYNSGDGTYNPSAEINFAVDGEPSSSGDASDMPGRIEFLTAPDGTDSESIRMTIKNDGKVGIGETSPETSLHIKNAGNSFLTLERSGTTGGTGKFGINMEGGSSQQTTMAYDDGGKLVIGRSSDPATQAGFNNDFILKGGFVGIKTLDPQVELHVTGNANISGSTTSGGVITANHIIRSDAGHNTARVEAVYDDGAAQYDSNILMWVSEPGYTYDSGGIGVNIHESGHYYGRKYDNDYAVFMRLQKSDGSIQFGQNQGTSGSAGASQVETLKITANGTLRLATTGGIGFGSTNAGDILDDYEEGNFTPTFVASGGTAPSSQTGTGQYTKIGDVVHITGQIVWNGAGSGGSNLYISIPFNVISDARAGLAIGLNSGVNYAQDHTLHLVPEINTNVMYVISTHYSVSGHTHLSYSNISNSGSKIFSFSGSFHTRD